MLSAIIQMLFVVCAFNIYCDFAFSSENSSSQVIVPFVAVSVAALLLLI